MIFKRWRLRGGNWFGGQSFNFWRKKNALKKFEEIKDQYLFVDLEDRKGHHQTERLKNNPHKVSPPPVLVRNLLENNLIKFLNMTYA